GARPGRGGATLALRPCPPLALAGARGRPLAARRARRMAGTARNHADAGGAGIALAGWHEGLGPGRLGGRGRALGHRLGRAGLGFPLGLAAFGLLPFGFLADLPAAIVFLDAAGLLGREALAVLGLPGTGQRQRLAPGLGLGGAEPERRPVLLAGATLAGPALPAGRAGAPAKAGTGIGLGHHAGAF